jgi:hypothetical protein
VHLILGAWNVSLKTLAGHSRAGRLPGTTVTGTRRANQES